MWNRPGFAGWEAEGGVEAGVYVGPLAHDEVIELVAVAGRGGRLFDTAEADCEGFFVWESHEIPFSLPVPGLSLLTVPTRHVHFG